MMTVRILRFSALVLLCLFGISPAHAQHGQYPLDAFADMYRSLNNARVLSTYDRVRNESVVSTDGRYLDLYWDVRDGSPDDFASVTAWDGRSMIGTHGHGDYQQFKPDSPDYFRFPSPVNKWNAPWIWVDRIVQDMRKAGDIKLSPRTTGGWQARSEQSGWLLEWDDGKHLVRLRHEQGISKPDLGFDIHLSQFSKERVSHNIEYPAHMTIEFLGLAQESSDENIIINEIIQSVAFNLEDIDKALTFDPVALGSNRFDTKTHNVYAPDGSLVYNEDKFVAQFDRAYGLRKSTRKWLPWLLLLAAMLSGTVAYWRIRQRTA